MKIKPIPILCMVATVTPVMAQADYVNEDGDHTTGGLWTEVGAAKVLPHNLNLSLDAGFRTTEWFDEADRFDIGLSLGWKPTKHWKFGAGYTFITKHSLKETAHKSTTEYEWKYRPVDSSLDENTDFPDFMGAPTYTDAENNEYRYHGYNKDEKDYTRVTDAFWRPRHRLSFDGAYTYKFWKTLRVTLRERYQLTFVPSKEVNRTRIGTKTTTKYRDPNYDLNGDLVAGPFDEGSYDEIEGPTVSPADEETIKDKSKKTLHVLRSRLTFEIDKKGWNITPYAYAELFNDLKDDFHTNKVRTSAGIEYDITKKHRVQVGYLFQYEDDDDGDLNTHAFTVGYKFKF